MSVRPSIDYLHALFGYDPLTGVLIWKARPREHFHSQRLWNAWNARFAGQKAGTLDDGGYWVVNFTFEGKFIHLKASHIAWALTTGRWPERQIDHQNRKRADNCFDNLREGTNAQNCQNRSRRRTNTSGFTGVSWMRVHRKWRARITLNAATTHLGLFDTAEEASQAVIAAKADLHPFSGVES